VKTNLSRIGVFDTAVKSNGSRPNYVQHEREQVLREAILRRPSIFREVVQLQQAQECSAQELAQALGISVRAVKSRLSRAKTALRTILLERDGQHDGVGRS
jgi:DNA-directed RNA polymerase specialized sigma24 family protein